MQLANSCGFVNGIRLDRVLPSRKPEFAPWPGAQTIRGAPLEPMIIDKDALSLSGRSTTVPGSLFSWHSSGSSLSDGEPAFVNTRSEHHLGVEMTLPVQMTASSGLLAGGHDRETSGERDRSEQIPANRETPANASENAQSSSVSLKSLGSAKHPLECTECHFFVFNSTGCKAGKDCTFCHELHPRRNPKKNRRYMSKQKETETSAFAPSSDDAEDVKQMTVSYSEAVLSTANPLILVAGVRTHFPARVEYLSEDYSSLQEQVKFTVSPALPEGLHFDSKSGLISGVPMIQQECSLYEVAAIVDVFAPSGLSLGKFTLASCTVPIRIVDLPSCMVSSLDGEKMSHIKLQWR